MCVCVLCVCVCVGGGGGGLQKHIYNSYTCMQPVNLSVFFIAYMINVLEVCVCVCVCVCVSVWLGDKVGGGGGSATVASVQGSATSNQVWTPPVNQSVSLVTLSCVILVSYHMSGKNTSCFSWKCVCVGGWRRGGGRGSAASYVGSMSPVYQSVTLLSHSHTISLVLCQVKTTSCFS